jgi:FtsH-binding integral membrane protein
MGKQGGVEMERFDMRSPSALRMTAEVPAERVTAFLQKVYGWMFAGLAVTAVVAFTVASSPTLLQYIFSNQLLFIGLILAELGLVFYLSARVETLAPNVAMTLFIVYSALNGVTLSFILLIYTGESIASTFLVTAGMFGAMAVYGSTTKRSLAGVGQFFFMGLIGLVLASIVGLFWHNDTLQFLISIIGVIVFTGLTDGLNGARESDGYLRSRRCSRPLPEFHQPLLDAPALVRRPPRLTAGRREDAPSPPGPFPLMLPPSATSMAPSYPRRNLTRLRRAQISQAAIGDGQLQGFVGIGHAGLVTQVERRRHPWASRLWIASSAGWRMMSWGWHRRWTYWSVTTRTQDEGGICHDVSRHHRMGHRFPRHSYPTCLGC